MKRILVFIAASLLLVSCGMNKMKTEYFVYNESVTLPDNAPEQMKSDTMKISYNIALPVGEKWKDARETIIKGVIAENEYAGDDTLSILTHIEGLKDMYFQEFDSFMEDYAENPNRSFMPPFAYEYVFDGDFAEPCKEKRFVNYKLSCECFTGGQHGMYWETYFTFNPEDGGRVMLSDIVPQEKYSSLRDQIYVKLTDNDGFVPDYISADSELCTENFIVEDSCLTFIYNPYEVAPYSSGLIAISLSWEEVESL